MTEPTDKINNKWTVQEIEEKFEGEDFVPYDPNKPHFICDMCSKGVPYSSKPRVAFYVADDILNPEHPAWSGDNNLVPLASYCEDCSKRVLFFPCEGFGEARIFFDLDEDRVMENVEVTDCSPKDDGIPWNPKKLSEKVTQIPWEEHMLMNMAQEGGDQMWGPENMITFFLVSVEGIDPRELIKWDGSFDPKKLGQARKKWESFQKKMAKGGYSRDKFKDHARGDK